MEIFGPNTERVLRFVAALPDLSWKDLGTAASVWRETNERDRSEAWVQAYRAARDCEWNGIVTAASVARWVALEAAGHLQWPDWAFWAAASDAGAGIAAGGQIGRHYDTLVTPLAAVMRWLPLQERDAA